MTYSEMKKLYLNSKHPKIASVLYWRGNRQFQVNYKSGKTCFYCDSFNCIPKTVKSFIANSNKEHDEHMCGDFVRFYFMVQCSAFRAVFPLAVLYFGISA